MLKLLKKLILFLLLFITINLLLFIKNLLIVNNYHLDKNVNKLIIGDSHISCGLDDSFIEGAKNIANTNEAYIYTYAKLKKVLKNNPHIDTVFLGVGVHNFSNYVDKNLYTLLANNLFFIEESQFLEIYKFQEKEFNQRIEPIIPLLRNNIKFLFSYDPIIFFGGFKTYENSDGDKLEYIKNRIKTQFLGFKESKIQLNYLDSISQICYKKNIKLIAINTPVSIDYYKNLPDSCIEKYNKITSNLNVINIPNSFLSKTDYLPDGDHLSLSGSKKTSIFLNNLLK